MEADINALMTDEESANVNSSSTEEIVRGHCESCKYQRDCADHDNNDTAMGLTWHTNCKQWEYPDAELPTADLVKIIRAISFDDFYGYDYLQEKAKLAADRLELLESELLQKTQELKQNKEWHDASIATATKNIVDLEHQVAALTARAEGAEAERDAAIADFDVIAQDGLCEVCFFGDFSEVSKDVCMEDCCFQWRSKKRWNPKKVEKK